ncbi:MAG: MBL fold metallo-hydrolase [Patescibacteria group bacterium]
MKETTYKGATITALGHDGFRVDVAEPQISFAFDPYDINGENPPVNFVFVSHPHFDHCDISSIRKLLGPKSRIIAPSCCKNELQEFIDQLDLYEGTEKVATNSLTYWTIPAYNVDKFRTPNEVFHPRELGGVGFVVEIPIEGSKNLRFYHAGDTDLVPEMEEVKKIDVAFLPISGTFVMTLDEAIKATELIEPDLAIPMHYGKILGSVAEANRFQNLLHDKTNVAVLSTESI